jgi:hypothetical protein
MREILAELERQGGLTAPMVPRGSWYHTNPNHQMMRKSQRSNTLRLRFGKRSAAADDMGLFQEQPMIASNFQEFQQQRAMEPMSSQLDTMKVSSSSSSKIKSNSQILIFLSYLWQAAPASGAN